MKKKVINVFFDTEFTTLEDKAKLVSIGCVAAGGHRFYAELTDTYQHSDCSDFVINVVLPLLTGADAAMFEIQAAHRLSAWVESLSNADQEVVFRSDAPPYDWPFVEYLFTFYDCWPANLRRKCSNMSFDNANFAHRYNAAQAAYWKTNAHLQHNALTDAQGLLFSWKYVIKRGI